MSEKRRRRPKAKRQYAKRNTQDLVKGRHAVEALITLKPRRILKLYVWGRRTLTPATVARLADLKIPVIDHPPTPDLAGDHLAQGIAAHVSAFEYADLDTVAPANAARSLLLLDSVTDAHNLGAILRSAVFFGFDAVILPRDRACPVGPAVERIARGATATLSIARVTNLARTIATLRDRGYLTVATTLAEDAQPLHSQSLSAPIALVLGGEERGIRRLVAQRCDVRVTLAPQGPMQSLNVAAFAAVLMAACRSFKAGDSA